MWAWVEMRPGVSTRSRASTVSSTWPWNADRGPTWTIRSPSSTTAPSRRRRWLASVEGDHVAGVDQGAARRGHERSPSPKSAELAPLRPVDPGDGVEVGGAEEAQQGVGDRPELLRDVVVVVGRRGRLAGRLGAGRGHDVGDDAARPAGLLARRLHVRRRRLRVRVERLADRLPVGELVVEPAGAEVGHEAADEVARPAGRGRRARGARAGSAGRPRSSRAAPPRGRRARASRRPGRPPGRRSASCCRSRRRGPRA